MTPPPHPAAEARTLLVVDDQPGVRITLAYTLKNAGYKVFTAESGLAAIGIGATESIDGAIIDIHMPGLNGIETCEQLQKQARAAGRVIRVWFMTGANSDLIESRADELGTLGVLTKPFDVPALLAGIATGLSSPAPSRSAPRSLRFPESESEEASRKILS